LLLFLPLISVNVKEQSGIYYFGKTLSEVLVTANGRKSQTISASGYGLTSSILLFKVYIAGMIVFGLKLLTDIINLLVLIIRNKKLNEHIIHFKGFSTAGFSAMGYIFVNRSLGQTDTDEIIKHEQNHLDHNHFLDILFIEAIKVFQWFNPFIYLFNRSLRAVHEYQADAEYLRSGMSVSSYQCLLLNHVFRSGIFNVSNSFSNPSLIKKRMIMMIKRPSGNSTSLKILLAIPVTILFLLAISACETNINLSRTTTVTNTPELPASQPIDIAKAPVYKKVKSVEAAPMPPPPPPPPPPAPVVNQNNTTKSSESISDNPQANASTVNEEAPVEVFTIVEQMPTFPGGDKGVSDFIYANIMYPESAKVNNIQGRVTVKFCVTYKGTIGQVQIVKGVDPILDKEAMRVIKMLPDWIPGQQGGKPVNVWYIFPVLFKLQ
jgi:TonB family protein